VKNQYVVSYNTLKKSPNYVAWNLKASDIGTIARTDAFSSDSSLPLTKQSTLGDFVGSGFSRGHLCPSADRTDSTVNNKTTFLLTNMVPQTAQSNNGTWKDLEILERTLAQNGNHLFIVAGPVYSGAAKTIGNGVAVPSSIFKVIVVLKANQTIAQIDSTTQVIAVEIPNTDTVNGTWELFKTSVDSIEAKTGLDFLSDLPVALQGQLER
jgi:endonuclease G, mitochondrial